MRITCPTVGSGVRRTRVTIAIVNKVTLIVWSNLTVDLDEMTTANTFLLKVLDQIYTVSPLAPAR